MFKLGRGGRTAVIAGALSLVLAVGSATPALAAKRSTTDSDQSAVAVVFAPMTVKSYNSAVANANGYQIVTNSDGTQSSVPVTAAAIAQRKEANAARTKAMAGRAAIPSVTGGVVEPAGDAWGDCGGSNVQAVKKANNQLVWTSGFSVFGAASGYSWHVNAIGAITTNAWDMSGNGPASGHKDFEGAGTVIGPGYATVPIWSLVTLVDGSVCYSEGPIAYFG